MIRVIKFFIFLYFIVSVFDVPTYAREVNSKSATCRQVGMILSSQDPNLRGMLCEGDRLVVKSKIFIGCRFKPYWDWLESGEYEVSKICPSQERIRKCRNSCNRNAEEIALIGHTFSARILTPILRWTEVKEAKGYELIIESVDRKVALRKTLDTPEYPLDVPLEQGGFYRIQIFALGTNQSGSFAFHILSTEAQHELNSVIEMIRDSEWSAKEKAIYQDSVYMSYGLLLDAILVLENTPELEDSPELQRRLNERYLEAGLIEKAKRLKL